MFSYDTAQLIRRPNKECTVIILSFCTDKSWQTVQAQIRLLLEEQSDQGLPSLIYHLHLFDEIPYGLAISFEL